MKFLTIVDKNTFDSINKHFKLFIMFFLVFFAAHNLIIANFLFSYLCVIYKLLLLNKLLNSMVLMDLLSLLKKDLILLDLNVAILPSSLIYLNIVFLSLLIALQMVRAFMLFQVIYCAL